MKYLLAALSLALLLLTAKLSFDYGKSQGCESAMTRLYFNMGLAIFDAASLHDFCSGMTQ